MSVYDCDGMAELRKMIAAEDRIFISAASDEAGDNVKYVMRGHSVHVDFSERENAKAVQETSATDLVTARLVHVVDLQDRIDGPKEDLDVQC